MKGRRRKVGEWFVRIRLQFGFFRVDNQFSCTWVTSQSTFQCGGFTHTWFIYQSCKFSLSKRMDSYWITYPMLNWRYKSCISKFVIPELWTTFVALTIRFRSLHILTLSGLSSSSQGFRMWKMKLIQSNFYFSIKYFNLFEKTERMSLLTHNNLPQQFGKTLVRFNFKYTSCLFAAYENHK